MGGYLIQQRSSLATFPPAGAGMAVAGAMTVLPRRRGRVRAA